jgi:hypothetical protein
MFAPCDQAFTSNGLRRPAALLIAAISRADQRSGHSFRSLLGVAFVPVQAMRLPAVSLAALLLLAGCQRGPSADAERLDRLELRLQQLEQRQASPGAGNTADKAGKPPAGPVKSLTFRMGTSDDRLRIYWADGTSSDLPCTKEQSTWACG